MAESSDVVGRAKAEVARIDGRDGPFCVDCQDFAVGVDTELVAELVGEVERLRVELAALHVEWGWDVKGRKKPNPKVILGDDGRPAGDRPELAESLGGRLYSRQVADWEAV